jgi:serine phosphatase RsbU (regulator of sigma subunit)
MNNSVIDETKIDELNIRLWKNRYDNPAEVINQSSSILIQTEKAGYLKGSSYSRLNIAVCSFLQSKNDVTQENLSEALLWFSNNPSEPGYSRALNLKGNLFESFGDYENALQFCLLARKLSIEINDRETEAETCSQLGMIYTRLCNFMKALEYFSESLKIREEIHDENAIASSLNRLGMIMRLIKKYNESLEFYEKSLQIRRRNNQPASIPWTMLGIASTYEEMHKTPEALEYYQSGMQGGDIRCSLQCIMGTGRILSITGHTDKAEEKLQESLKMAKKVKFLSLVAEAYASLANHYKSTGQYKKALKNHILYHKAKESVLSEEAQSRLRNVEISYAIEKSEKEKEIFRLRHVELKKAYEIIEEKNKDITAGINYASRIQRAILTNPDEITGLSNKCFILYLPKEIVSGDFYWFTRTGEKLIMAVGDCTGHGVPGALMSMLGISFLEEIVNHRKITQSGDILNELRKEIQRALHQRGNREDARDGMDISIVVINSIKNIIQYSGAYQNLYMIHDDKLIEYQADRMPIGIFELSDKNFTTQIISSKAGDFIYMFSDGYADQFGGPDHKKYNRSSLKNLLLKIHKMPLSIQKQVLEKEFNDWKGEHVQIDDVLVVGLSI